MTTLTYQPDQGNLNLMKTSWTPCRLESRCSLSNSNNFVIQNAEELKAYLNSNSASSVNVVKNHKRKLHKRSTEEEEYGLRSGLMEAIWGSTEDGLRRH